MCRLWVHLAGIQAGSKNQLRHGPAQMHQTEVWKLSSIRTPCTKAQFLLETGRHSSVTWAALLEEHSTEVTARGSMAQGSLLAPKLLFNSWLYLPSPCCDWFLRSATWPQILRDLQRLLLTGYPHFINTLTEVFQNMGIPRAWSQNTKATVLWGSQPRDAVKGNFCHTQSPLLGALTLNSLKFRIAPLCTKHLINVILQLPAYFQHLIMSCSNVVCFHSGPALWEDASSTKY